MALRLLVTRPQPQADTWVARLREQGIDAQALPLLTITCLADPAALHAAWRDLSRKSLVVFVSPNAVSHFFAARPKEEAAQAWPATTRAAATGPGTVAALQAAGVPAAQCVAPPADAAQFDSAALWALLCADAWAGQEVLVVRGNGGRDELADHLRAAGATLHFVQAYTRSPVLPDALQRQAAAAALAQPRQHLWWLSSAEALDGLPAWAPAAAWRPAMALASHPRIAERARQAGFGLVFESQPTMAAVQASLRRVEAYLQSLPS